MLNISYTNVGGKGIALLKNFPKLTKLYLAGLNGVNEGLEGLNGNDVLEEVYFNNSDLNDKGMNLIKTFKKLRKLSITFCMVSDKSMDCLLELPLLEELFVGPSITDKSIESLKKLNSIKTIDFGNNSSVSENAINELKRALPNAHVFHVAKQ